MDGHWSTYEIEQAYLKWHPVCAHLGPMLDCFEALRAKVESRPLADITDVRVDVYSTALQYDSPAPSNDLAARFSFRHAAAIALTCGVVRHDAFGTSVLSDPDIQSMAKKIRIEADPVSMPCILKTARHALRFGGMMAPRRTNRCSCQGVMARAD